MRKYTTLPLIMLVAIIAIFSSCEDGSLKNSKTYIFSVGLDYEKLSKATNGTINVLYNTVRDASAMAWQLSKLYPNSEVTLFLNSGASFNIYKDPEFTVTKKTENKYNSEKDAYEEMDSFDINPTGLISDRWKTADVISAIKNTPAGENDLIVFFYSGHGVGSSDENINGSLLMEYEGDVAGFIEPDALLSAFDGFKCPVVIILDSCRSGAFIKNSTLASTDSFVTISNNSLTNYSILYRDGLFYSDGKFSNSLDLRKASDSNIYILTACHSNQDSMEGVNTPGKANSYNFSAFTYRALEYLGFKAKDIEARSRSKKLTLFGMYNYAWENYPSLYDKIQNPLYSKEYETFQVTRNAMDLVLVL